MKMNWSSRRGSASQVAGGRRPKTRTQTLLSDLEDLMKESTASDPMSLLKWKYKSTYAIAGELQLK